jgi:DNA recombination protein RmuC
MQANAIILFIMEPITIISLSTAAASLAGCTYLVVRQNKLITRASEAESALRYKQELLDSVVGERSALNVKLDEERETRLNVERSFAQREQEIKDIRAEMENEEKKMELLKGQLSKMSTDMSSKLLDDHKREAKNLQEEQEKRIHNTTKELHEKFEKVFGSMETLHGQVKQVEQVRQALLNPSGAGQLSEITLANIFEASSLLEGQDYFTQFADLKGPSGNVLKPDAVVMLPNNSVLVIDAKASKFFQEIAEAGTAPDKKKAAEANLKRSMNEHLKSLIVRDYKAAFEEKFKKERSGELGNVSMLMFLPTESSLETIRKLDPAFLDRAWKEQITPVGPAGLVNMLLYSRLQISNAKQFENFKEISNEIKGLLGNVSRLHELSTQLGKGVKGAFEKYDKFAGSFNTRFLSSLKRLDQLGLGLPKEKSLTKLERYRFITDDFDGEAEELPEQETSQRLEKIESVF